MIGMRRAARARRRIRLASSTSARSSGPRSVEAAPHGVDHAAERVDLGAHVGDHIVGGAHRPGGLAVGLAASAMCSSRAGR